MSGACLSSAKAHLSNEPKAPLLNCPAGIRDPYQDNHPLTNIHAPRGKRKPKTEHGRRVTPPPLGRSPTPPTGSSAAVVPRASDGAHAAPRQGE